MTDMKTNVASALPADVQQQAQDWLLRLHGAAVSEADADAFRRWRGLDPRHAAAFAQARALWKALGPALQATGGQTEQTLVTHQVSPVASLPPAVHADSHARPRSRTRMGRRAFLGGAVAAAAGGCWLAASSPLGLWPELGALGADYRTATGERRELEIQGVTVAMGTRTRLRRSDDHVRGLQLSQGEAQFALPAWARRGFEIQVEGARVMLDPGARVNVRCVGMDVRVTCLAGAAALVRGARTVALQQGWQARLDGARIASVGQVPTERVDAWRHGWLMFDDQPLSEVVEEINRYRTGRIVIADSALSQRRVQARISLQRIDTFIDLVRDAYGARVVSMPGDVVLLG